MRADVSIALIVVNLAVTPLSAETTKIMPLGDSITRGMYGNIATNGSYRQYIGRQLTALDVDFDLVGNYQVQVGEMIDPDFQAVGGYTIEKMVEEFHVSVQQHKPDFILVLAGTNNMWSDLDSAAFEQRYESLIQMARENAPGTEMIFATVPPMACCQASVEYWTPTWVSARNAMQTTMNQALRTVADRHDDVHVAPYAEQFDINTDLADDKVHPIGMGQLKLGRAFLSELGDLRYGLLNASNIDNLVASIANKSDSLRGDLNADGLVDLDDLTYLIHDVIGTSFGDANLDGQFDFEDLLQVIQVAEYEDNVPGNSGWADGDWNGDNEFDSSDLIAAFRRDNDTRIAIAVAEPRIDVWILASCVLAPCVRRRIQRRHSPAQ